MLGEGNNHIPMIHVQDVGRLIRKMIFEGGSNKIPQYILAVDENNTT